MASTASSQDQGTGIDRYLRDGRRAVGQKGTDVAAGTGVADWLAIERMLNGIGDENQLFRDPNYGAASWHRTMLAPPSFVLAVRTPTSAGSLNQGDYEGLLPMLTEAEIEWDDHIRLGDRLDSDIRVTRVHEGPEWKGRKTGHVHSGVEYIKQGAARPFARATGISTLYPIKRGQEKFIEREIYSYSDEEIAQLEQDLQNSPEERGSRPRYWNNVNVGDSLGTMVKGPLTLSDLMSWMVGEAKPIKLGGLVHKEVMANPGRRTTNPSTNWPYWDADQEAEDIQSSQDAGFPGPYGRGAMRVGLATHLLTNWMGDDAFLRRISVQLPNPFIYGDVMRLSGEVTDKFTQQIGDHTYNAVEISLSGVNQLGETVLSGSATVFLPNPGFPVELPVGQ
jgi:acyl dehydratase